MIEELLLKLVGPGDVEPNLFDVAAVSPLVGVGSGSLEENSAVLVDAAFGWHINQNGRWDEVEFVLPDFNWRVIQAVVRADTEGDVTLTLGVCSPIPFVDPILERMSFHRDFSVSSGNVRSVEPIAGAWWLNLNPLDHTELCLLCRVVVGIGPFCAIPCLTGDSDGAGEGEAIRLVDSHAWTEVVKVDDVVNRSREDIGEIISAAAKFEGFNRVEGALSTGDTVVVITIDEGVPIVVDTVCTGIFVHHNRLTCSVVCPRDSSVLVADDMVPVAVKQEVRGKRYFLSEAKGVRGQFVKWKTGGVLDHHGSTFNVGVLGLHLIANQFTFTNLRAPSGVLVLDMNHGGIKVLQVGKGEHRGVLDQFKGKRHLRWWQSDGSRNLKALILDIWALSAEPADADRIEFAVARRWDLFGLDGDTGFRHVVDLRDAGP